MAGVFVAGTDTGVGKTHVSCLLVRALREAGVDAVGLKPVCCGDHDDTQALFAASDEVEPVEVINPVWFRTPVAPAVAVELEGGSVECVELKAHAEVLASRHEMVVCEGVGGWEVPMNKKENASDLAKALGWPVILVVANKLGALNHTLLTAQAIKAAGLSLAGVVLNHLEEERDVAMVSNESVLRARVETEAWTTLMPGQDWLEPEFMDVLKGILL